MYFSLDKIFNQIKHFQANFKGVICETMHCSTTPDECRDVKPGVLYSI